MGQFSPKIYFFYSIQVIKMTMMKQKDMFLLITNTIVWFIYTTV